MRNKNGIAKSNICIFFPITNSKLLFDFNVFCLLDKDITRSITINHTKTNTYQEKCAYNTLKNYSISAITSQVHQDVLMREDLVLLEKWKIRSFSF